MAETSTKSQLFLAGVLSSWLLALFYKYKWNSTNGGGGIRELRKVWFCIQRLGALKRFNNDCPVGHSVLLDIFWRYRSGVCV